MIKFPRSVLVTRLVETTSKLTANKARLQAQVVTTETEEALSKTEQGILMELEEPSTPNQDGNKHQHGVCRCRAR